VPDGPPDQLGRLGQMLDEGRAYRAILAVERQQPFRLAGVVKTLRLEQCLQQPRHVAGTAHGAQLLTQAGQRCCKVGMEGKPLELGEKTAQLTAASVGACNGWNMRVAAPEAGTNRTRRPALAASAKRSSNAACRAAGISPMPSPRVHGRARRVQT